jgi:hypothetical protein
MAACNLKAKNWVDPEFIQATKLLLSAALERQGQGQDGLVFLTDWVAANKRITALVDCG